MAGEPKVELRTIKVPLVFLKDEEWRDLRRIAYQCSSYGNLLLSEQYAKVRGIDGFTTYRDARDKLSAGVRDAVGREVVGIWRRLGKLILRGNQTLARFSADRALVCRDRAVHVARDSNTYTVSLRLRPKKEPQFVLTVFAPALRRDRHLRETLSMLANHPEKVRKGSVSFERPGQKVFLYISYAKDVFPVASFSKEAILSVMSDGEAVLQCDGNRLTLNDFVYRMSFMKMHFSRIQARLRISLGRSGRRRDLRKALLKLKGFEHWVVGPMHQMSSRIVKWMIKQNAGVITVSIDEGAPELPWTTLENQIRYKLSEVVDVDKKPKGSEGNVNRS